MNATYLNLRNATIALLLAQTSAVQAEWDTRAELSFQAQAFTDSALHTADQSINVSIAGVAEFYHPVGESGDITITPFFRVDQHDDQRTHFDFREFLYRYSADDWEIKAGLGKVFWGVAESSNVVDIINQRDAVEGLDAENKLGQPMINLLLLRDWGEVSLFVLPGFRERTFAGNDGRPRGFFALDTDNATYESEDENQHIDIAARVSKSVDEWDVGVHAFRGTSREPQINFETLSPHYVQITQFGVDIQGTFDSWLLKSEAAYQSGDQIDNHIKTVTGFEYSFYGVAQTDTDLGIVAEWLFDSRGLEANQPFQSDLLLGLRVALNDEQSSEALISSIFDMDGGATIFAAQASRRIGESFVISAEATIWSDVSDDPALAQLGQEDYLQLELSYFY